MYSDAYPTLKEEYRTEIKLAIKNSDHTLFQIQPASLSFLSLVKLMANQYDSFDPGLSEREKAAKFVRNLSYLAQDVVDHFEALNELIDYSSSIGKATITTHNSDLKEDAQSIFSDLFAELSATPASNETLVMSPVSYGASQDQSKPEKTYEIFNTDSYDTVRGNTFDPSQTKSKADYVDGILSIFPEKYKPVVVDKIGAYCDFFDKRYADYSAHRSATLSWIGVQILGS